MRLAGLVALASMGCGPAAVQRPAPADPREMPAAPPRHFSSGTALERYVPLIDGNVYQYDYESGDEHGTMTVRVQRFDDAHGAWILPSGGNVFEYRADGVLSEGDKGQSYLLQQPLEIGHRWRGAHQSWIEIHRTDAVATVPAGTFPGCVETIEARGGDVPLSISAIFCPDIGMVQREIMSGKRSERLALRSYGAPVNIGPSGLRVYKGPPSEGWRARAPR